MLEGYTALGFVAATTEKLRLRLLVTGVTYRHPGLLAKCVTTLDVLSGGGASSASAPRGTSASTWCSACPTRPTANGSTGSKRRSRSACRCGATTTARTRALLPARRDALRTAPAQSPRPRILIGGGGERRTLRLVAQYADACNLFTSPNPDDIRHKLDVLRGHCEAVGRDYDSIQKTILGRVDPEGDVREFLSSMEQYAALGVGLVEVAPAMPDPARFVTLLGEKVVPALAQMG